MNLEPFMTQKSQQTGFRTFQNTPKMTFIISFRNGNGEPWHSTRWEPVEKGPKGGESVALPTVTEPELGSADENICSCRDGAFPIWAITGWADPQYSPSVPPPTPVPPPLFVPPSASLEHHTWSYTWSERT